MSDQPSYLVYIDDSGEVHIVAPGGKNPWDGKAFFLGRTFLSIRDLDGNEIPTSMHNQRVSTRRFK
jgi:hypothetical protein